MRACKRIDQVSGNKSSVMLQIINRRERERVRENLEEIKKNKEVDKILNLIWKEEEKFHEQKRKHDERIANLEKRLNKYGVRPRYRFTDGMMEIELLQCYVPEETRDKLQKASDLYAMGKHSKAKQLWSEVSEEWGLEK